MKIEINEWLLYLPFFVSFFWIFIYKWKDYGLGKLNKKQKAIVKKETKKWKLFYTWEDYGLKRPKHSKWTKIDYVMYGIFVLYSAYYLFIETW